MLSLWLAQVAAGKDVDFLTYKFQKLASEEQDRNVIGMSAKGKCWLLAGMVDKCQLKETVPCPSCEMLHEMFCLLIGSNPLRFLLRYRDLMARHGTQIPWRGMLKSATN